MSNFKDFNIYETVSGVNYKMIERDYNKPEFKEKLKGSFIVCDSYNNSYNSDNGKKQLLLATENKIYNLSDPDYIYNNGLVNENNKVSISYDPATLCITDNNQLSLSESCKKTIELISNGKSEQYISTEYFNFVIKSLNEKIDALIAASDEDLNIDKYNKFVFTNSEDNPYTYYPKYKFIDQSTGEIKQGVYNGKNKIPLYKIVNSATQYVNTYMSNIINEISKIENICVIPHSDNIYLFNEDKANFKLKYYNITYPGSPIYIADNKPIEDAYLISCKYDNAYVDSEIKFGSYIYSTGFEYIDGNTKLKYNYSSYTSYLSEIFGEKGIVIDLNPTIGIKFSQKVDNDYEYTICYTNKYKKQNNSTNYTQFDFVTHNFSKNDSSVVKLSMNDLFDFYGDNEESQALAYDQKFYIKQKNNNEPITITVGPVDYLYNNYSSYLSYLDSDNYVNNNGIWNSSYVGKSIFEVKYNPENTKDITEINNIYNMFTHNDVTNTVVSLYPFKSNLSYFNICLAAYNAIEEYEEIVLNSSTLSYLDDYFS